MQSTAALPNIDGGIRNKKINFFPSILGAGKTRKIMFRGVDNIDDYVMAVFG